VIAAVCHIDVARAIDRDRVGINEARPRARAIGAAALPELPASVVTTPDVFTLRTVWSPPSAT